MDDGRGAPSNVRGWLSEVYLPALVSSQAELLLRRLGDRATVDDPLFGRAVGMPALARYLDEAASWLAQRRATFETVMFTTGSDRDVTEGILGLTVDGRPVRVPVAVVAERRPEREVEVRLYYTTRAVRPSSPPRAQLVPRDDELTVPPPVAAHLQALARGDLDAVMASFEGGATLRDPAGQTHAKQGQGGALRSFYEKVLGSHGIEVLKGARADDGRTCALEYTIPRVNGELVAQQPALAVYERGESGLLRALRLYHDS
ncbi:MAG TPA: hypothetical protein VE987_16495 [Polyangiaceae bacterium]|nr:hypothetical protein [Polyangiaceae bacterium]